MDAADASLPLGSLTVNELIIPGALGCYSVKNIFHSGVSQFQRINVVDLTAFGRTLLLDEKMQSCACDEFIYHENLVHPSLLAHENPKKVLILGGGEGGTAREILRFKSVERCVMVDIDEVVVNTSKEFLVSYHRGAWNNSRLELIIGDAKAYLENTEEKFDVIVGDLADPVIDNPCYMLYTTEFYEMLATRLAPGGIFVTQSGPAGLLNCHEVFVPVLNTLKKSFKSARPYSALCPAFFDHYGFVMASNDVDLSAIFPTDEDVDKLIEERVDATHETDASPDDKGLNATRALDGETVRSAFVMPKWLKNKIASIDTIISNDTPTFLS